MPKLWTYDRKHEIWSCLLYLILRPGCLLISCLSKNNLLTKDIEIDEWYALYASLSKSSVVSLNGIFLKPISHDDTDVLKKVWFAYQGHGTVYNQKNHFLLVDSGITTTYSSSNTKFSLKYFNIS